MAYKFNVFTGRLDIVNSPSSLGVHIEVPPEVPDGVIVDFTFANTPKAIVVDQGRSMIEGSGWSYVGTTVTVDISPTFEIFSIY